MTINKGGTRVFLKLWAEKAELNFVDRKSVKIVGIPATRKSETSKIESLVLNRYTAPDELKLAQVYICCAIKAKKVYPAYNSFFVQLPVIRSLYKLERTFELEKPVCFWYTFLTTICLYFSMIPRLYESVFYTFCLDMVL